MISNVVTVIESNFFSSLQILQATSLLLLFYSLQVIELNFCGLYNHMEHDPGYRPFSILPIHRNPIQKGKCLLIPSFKRLALLRLEPKAFKSNMPVYYV